MLGVNHIPAICPISRVASGHGAQAGVVGIPEAPREVDKGRLMPPPTRALPLLPFRLVQFDL